MDTIDKKDRSNQDNGELIEYEYELLESSEVRRPKRLRAKENKSKKSQTELKDGRVLECFTNNFFRVKTQDEEIICPLSGRFKNVDFNRSRSIVVVGDFVRVDISSNPRIEEIIERKNVLKRYISKQIPGRVEEDYKGDEKEVVLVANIDQVIITSSIQNPSINYNLIDRYLCSAEMSGIDAVICITKADLASESIDNEDIRYYVRAGYKILQTSVIDESGIDDLKKILQGQSTVFSGPSGAGKSTLINNLEPSLNLKTGSISTYSNKGKHVTSNSIMIEWSFGGFLIDTPGIKTFGLPKKAKEQIPKLFPGFNDYAQGCKFKSCSHTNEEGCRVLEELSIGNIPDSRYQSYLNLLSSE
jgi:ribosome biogenesis GTPase / thiamine phosphate phosphatase